MGITHSQVSEGVGTVASVVYSLLGHVQQTRAERSPISGLDDRAVRRYFPPESGEDRPRPSDTLFL